MLQTKPDDEEALLQLSQVSALQGRLAEANAALRKMIATGRNLHTGYNNLAWNLLFLPKLDPSALDYARQAVQLTQRRGSASLHTLATVLAETGHPEEARHTLLELFDLEKLEIPSSFDWYVIGRIAEQYGDKDSAVSAYRKVKDQDGQAPTSTAVLAERRLRILEKQ